MLLYNTALVIMMVGQTCSQNAWHVAPIYPGSLQTDSTQSGPTIQSSHLMSIITTALPFPRPIYNSGSTKYGKMCKFEASFQKCRRTFLPCHQSGNIKHTKKDFIATSENWRVLFDDFHCLGSGVEEPSGWGGEVVIPGARYAFFYRRWVSVILTSDKIRCGYELVTPNGSSTKMILISQSLEPKNNILASFTFMHR